MTETLNADLMNILACPVCKVHVSQQNDWIICSKCGRRYPIKDGIPDMLIEDAVMEEAPSGNSAE
jgi:hypothetical protein